MMKVSRQATKTPVPREAASFVRIRRISFADGPPPAGGGRRFTQPRSASALEEDVSIETVAAAAAEAEPLDHCFVLHVPEGPASQCRERAKSLWASAGYAEGGPAMTLEHSSDVVEWRPGLVVVQCREGSREDILAALVDFAFYEGHLRALERSVEAAEVQAQTDVTLAHRVRYRDRAQWERLVSCSESCSRMRLTFARLEPQLGDASRTLSPPARTWVSRLIQKADVESRLEALNDRLEALEELYEGAAQRISEYRWYVGGHALEIAIIVLLLIESTLMGADIYLHSRTRQESHGPPTTAEVRGEG
jgi:hypothetical protein